MSSTTVVLLRLIGKPRWPPYHLTVWDIFNETWQKTAQRSLQSLFYSGRTVNKDGFPELWLTEDIFEFPSETGTRNSMKFVRKQQLNAFSTNFVFSDRSENQEGRPAH